MKQKQKKKQEEEKKVPFVLIDKPINDIENDNIGIPCYIESLNEAINQGARVISINSKYGGGKSSVCNILKKNNRYNKTSTISLWDVIIEQKNGKKNKVELDVMSFYKSFLFQLSSDFYGDKYSQYISKALNKKTGFINIFFKTRIVLWSFILACVFAGIYILFEGINHVEWNFLKNILNLINVKINISFYKNLSLVMCFSLLLFTVFNGKIVYNSWKAECDRLLTLDDVTTLYAGIIRDSISFTRNNKNIIIIDDIDRCINNESKEIIVDFIKSVVKLLHFNCKNYFLRKKLESIVLILCIDEDKFIKDGNDEVLLKLFDYRLDIGKIHYEDFEGILNDYAIKYKKINDKKEQLMLLLDNPNNNIRLLKKEINDAFLKYETLLSRFEKEKETISFESCVAYSFLKNNYPLYFEQFITDSVKTTSNIRKAIEEYNANKEIYIEDIIKMELKNDNNDDNNNDNIKQKEFNDKIKEYIKMGYINENFKLYFYNYPKNEKCRNIYEYTFWNSLKGFESYDIKNNLMLTKSYILECAFDVNRIKMNYPKEILKDMYVLNVLFSRNDDEKLFALLLQEMSLNQDETIQSSLEILDFLCANINYENAMSYLVLIYEEQWNSKRILKNDLFYRFRNKLVQYAGDDIISYKNLFQGEFDSISLCEYGFILNKEITKLLINKLKFNSDLEYILLEIHNLIDIKQKIEYCKIWKNNIKNVENYLKFSIDTLSEYNEYDEEIIKSLESYLEKLENNEKFINYINTVIKKVSKDKLQKIDSHNIYFGLSDESIDIFLSNGITKTPLIFALKEKKFNKIIEFNVELKRTFEFLLQDNYENIHDNIREFKEFILYNSQTTKFEYLFNETKYINTFEIVINWKKVFNVFLLVICNKNDNKVIIENLEQKINVYSEDQILLLLKSIYDFIPQSVYVNSNLLIKILELYPYECKNIGKNDTIFNKIIRNLYIPYKYKFIIKYQTICNILLPEFYSALKNYNDAEDKKEYAKYVNTLPEDIINIELINSVNINYPYNDTIIKLFREKKDWLSVVKTYLLRKELYKAKNEIKMLNTFEIAYLWENFKDNRFDLLNNYIYVDRICDSGHVDLIDNIELISIIQSEKHFPYQSFKLILSNCKESKLISFLLGIKKIPKNNASNFIKILSENSNIKEIISTNLKIYTHLYNHIDINYKGSFNKKFHKNSTE